MNNIILGIFLSAIISVLTKVSGLSDTYRAAVVEYHPVKHEDDDFTLNSNAKNYIAYIEQASKKKVDIIVFPECGLFSSKLHPIPDPSDKVIPCDWDKFITTQTVKDFSCASKNNKIYSVINLREKRECNSNDKNCPSRGYYILNTNVVFDREGMVVARYSKYNLYDENVDKLARPEIVFFDTDFGVRFGTFICFDIMFPSPALKLYKQFHITDFVYTTFWFSEAPFLTALQAQRGWAEANDVNLLASGVNYPVRGSGGSGIYNGKYGGLVEIMPEVDTSQLLIADVPKIMKHASYSPQEKAPIVYKASEIIYNTSYYSPAVSEKLNAESELVLLRDHMRLFSSAVISNDKEEFDEKVCSRKNFCCDFHVVKNALSPDSNNYTIRAVALNGVRRFGLSFTGGVQVCAVLVCDGPDIMNCTNRIKNVRKLFKFEEISIKGNFNAKNSFQMPTTLSHELNVLSANKYEFTKMEKGLTAEVSLELLWPMFDLQAFGIWGRDFTRDMEPLAPESSASKIVSVPVVLGAFLAFFMFTR